MSIKLIAITGGIGSGKSVVSNMLRAMGYKVYDCDSRAKVIVDSDDEIKARLVQEIAPDCVDENGNVRRDRVAEIVFANPDALERLNRLIHSAVREDIRQVAAETNDKILFIETAILYQSELDKMVDEVWNVEAPLELRIERVMNRNGLKRSQVLARIESQDGFVAPRAHSSVSEIHNDEIIPILPQLEKLIKSLLEE